jgi:hypothetical protein
VPLTFILAITHSYNYRQPANQIMPSLFFFLRLLLEFIINSFLHFFLLFPHFKNYTAAINRHKMFATFRCFKCNREKNQLSFLGCIAKLAKKNILHHPCEFFCMLTSWKTLIYLINGPEEWMHEQKKG